MYVTTSWTVRIFSASSSEISMSYSSSSAITSSTMSSESAPRSSMNEACGVTSSSLTPSCSQMISFTFCSTVDPITLLLDAPASHVQAAVHPEHLPGHEAGGGRGQVRHRLGDLFRAAQAAGRGDGGEEGLLLLAEAFGHVGLDRARRDRVHG